MDHRSLNSSIISLHGEAAAKKVHHFERSRLQVTKLKSDLVFLKRCRDSSVIPNFARIKHNLNVPKNHGVFLKASLGLVRSEISRVRKDLDHRSRLLLATHLELANFFPASLWSRIDACSALKSLRLEESLRLRQSAKFNRLSGLSVQESSLFDVRDAGSRVSVDQVSSLRAWILNGPCPSSGGFDPPPEGSDLERGNGGVRRGVVSSSAAGYGSQEQVINRALVSIVGSPIRSQLSGGVAAGSMNVELRGDAIQVGTVLRRSEGVVQRRGTGAERSSHSDSSGLRIDPTVCELEPVVPSASLLQFGSLVNETVCYSVPAGIEIGRSDVVVPRGGSGGVIGAERSGPGLESVVSSPSFQQNIPSVDGTISLVKQSCQVAIKELKSWMTPQKVSTNITVFPSSAEIVPEPLGAALIISAWNYPFLLSMDPVIGAIAAGNVVVLKPSEVAPATSSLLARLISQYLDNSAIRVVEGSVAETTCLLEQKWDKIFYTGSGKIGRIVMAAAAKHLTPVTLELGGKCPVIVDPTVDLEVTARRIIAGKWGCNNGQACISPDYIITLESFAPKLIDALKVTLEKFFGKDPFQSADLSRIVNFSHFARLTRLLDDPKVSDKVIYGGQRDEKRLIIAPTLLLDAPMDSLIMTEEIFGPLLPIITVQKMEEALEVVTSLPKPLAAYLFTKDKKFERQVVASISAGGMVVNDTAIHLTNHHLPFGGVGESGMGAYHGKFSFETFSHKKAVLYRGFMGDLMVRYPPYTTRKQKIVRCLLTGDFLGLVYALIGWNS